LPSSSRMHLDVHKVDEVILTPELFLLLLNGKRLSRQPQSTKYSGINTLLISIE